MNKYYLLFLVVVFGSVNGAGEPYELKYSEGLSAYEKGHYGNAIDLFEESLALNENSITAFYLSASYFADEQWAYSKEVANLALIGMKPNLGPKKQKTLRRLIFESEKKLLLESYFALVDRPEYKREVLDLEFSKNPMSSQDARKANSLAESGSVELIRTREKLLELMPQSEIDRQESIYKLNNPSSDLQNYQGQEFPKGNILNYQFSE
jgi:flagellar basal body rod protein FlgB